MPAVWLPDGQERWKVYLTDDDHALGRVLLPGVR
jgi:hypothetical protein